MRTLVLVVLASIALTACGKNNQQRAVDACQKAVAEKLQGKTFELDLKDMLKNAKPGTDNVIALGSTVVFDKGLPSESKQTFDCRVLIDPKNADAEPAVQGLEFTW